MLLCSVRAVNGSATIRYLTGIMRPEPKQSEVACCSEPNHRLLHAAERPVGLTNAAAEQPVTMDKPAETLSVKEKIGYSLGDLAAGIR